MHMGETNEKVEHTSRRVQFFRMVSEAFPHDFRHVSVPKRICFERYKRVQNSILANAVFLLFCLVIHSRMVRPSNSRHQRKQVSAATTFWNQFDFNVLWKMQTFSATTHSRCYVCSPESTSFNLLQMQQSVSQIWVNCIYIVQIHIEQFRNELFKSSTITSRWRNHR